jgi:hypothetical protein
MEKEIKPKTVAETMVEQLDKISNALTELRNKGLPESLILAYVQKKTKISQRDILMVFDALKELNKELKKQ